MSAGVQAFDSTCTASTSYPACKETGHRVFQRLIHRLPSGAKKAPVQSSKSKGPLALLTAATLLNKDASFP